MDDNVYVLRNLAEDLEAKIQLHEDHLQDFRWDLEEIQELMEREEEELAAVQQQYTDTCAQINELETDDEL